jgi:hypothetical protein
MITIAANATIAAGASVASQVTCTLFGMELNGTTETYKVLDQRQLANSPATIYTATANGPTFIKSIQIVNNDTVARTFKLYSGGTAAANAITPTYNLLPSGLAIYEDGIGWQFYNSTGQLLTATGISNTNAHPLYAPTGFLAESIDRNVCAEVNATIPTAAGTLFMQAIYLTAGMVCSSISWFSATTAANGPTHWMFGLYDSSRNLLASTSDQTSTAWGANTIKTVAVGTPYTVPSTGLYYIGMFMTASSAIITSKGHTAKTGGQLAATAPILHGTSNTGLTTSLPNPANAITGGLVNVWCAIS